MTRQETCKGCDHPETAIIYRYALSDYYCEDCWGAYLDHLADRAEDDAAVMREIQPYY